MGQSTRDFISVNIPSDQITVNSVHRVCRQTCRSGFEEGSQWMNDKYHFPAQICPNPVPQPIVFPIFQIPLQVLLFICL